MQMLNLEKETSVDTKGIDPNGGTPSQPEVSNFTQKVESQKIANLDILLK